MDEQQIKDLILTTVSSALPEALKNSFSEFRAYFDDRLKETIEPLQTTLDSIEFLDPEDLSIGEGSKEDTSGDQDDTDNPDYLETTENLETMTKDPTLNNRLKVLEAKLAEAEKREKAALAKEKDRRFEKLLNDTLTAKGDVLHSPLVAELLTYRLRGIADETSEGQWLTKDGKSLSEAVEEFFSTPAGSHFIPSDHKNGLGTKKPSNIPSSTDISGISLDDMLSSGIFG
jgi:hypothetical protein